MWGMFVYREIITAVFTLIALLTIIKACFNKRGWLTLRAMGEYLAHWVFALFMIDFVGILSYVLLVNDAEFFNTSSSIQLRLNG